MKHPAEFFGAAALLYFLLLAWLAVILVRFLVATTLDSLKETASTKALPPMFMVEESRAVLEDVGRVNP